MVLKSTSLTVDRKCQNKEWGRMAFLIDSKLFSVEPKRKPRADQEKLKKGTKRSYLQS
jgi:hypothetical protein